MSNINQQLAIIGLFLAAVLSLSCQTQNQAPPISPQITPPAMADKFSYPVSKKEFVTELKDAKDDWYNALNFTEENHLGEDWNKKFGW